VDIVKTFKFKSSESPSWDLTNHRLVERDKLRGAGNYHQWADEIDNTLRSKELKSYIQPMST
jgi:hypothetical protein